MSSSLELDSLNGSRMGGGNLQIWSPFMEYMVFAVIFYVLWKWNWSEVSRKAFYLKAFPGPKTLPIIGNGHMMIFKPTDFYKWSWALCRKWGGDAVVTWRLNFPMVWVSSLETALELLSNPRFVAKSQDIDMFWRQSGGNGLSSAPGHLHNARRKLLYPGYTRQVVERSVYIFTEEMKRLVKKLEPLAKSGEVFEIMEVIMPASFRIICRSTFGDALIAEQSDDEALRQMHALHKISQNFTNRLMSPYLWLRNDFIYFNFTSEGRKTWKYMQTINEFGRMAIKSRRQDRERGGVRDKHDANSNRGPPCYLDMLLDFCDKGDLKEGEVLGELNNYIAAGYDTTALAIAWTLFALALNGPSHQEKIVEELEGIFEGVPTQDLIITAADTKKMKYLELCLKESMRLFPVSPALPRSTTSDMVLKDGRVIPSDTDVVIMIDMIHRDPRYFKDPDVFRPERHLEPNPAFLPFSTGVRNCIGQVFAMHQVKVELAGLIREFQWETVDREETLPRLFQALMVPAEGIRFRIRKRIHKVSN